MRAYRKNKNAGWVFYLAVFLAILPLVWVKLSPFMTGKTTLLGFLGISYLTFKAVQVVMDLRDGVMKRISSVSLHSVSLVFPDYFFRTHRSLSAL